MTITFANYPIEYTFCHTTGENESIKLRSQRLNTIVYLRNDFFLWNSIGTGQQIHPLQIHGIHLVEYFLHRTLCIEDEYFIYSLRNDKWLVESK
jgi:hypothetical protein